MHMIQIHRTLSSALLLVAMIAMTIPGEVFAAKGSDLNVAGWIPYWRDSEGIKDAKKHIRDIDTIYPFAYTVTLAGELADQAGLDKRDWKNFIKDARKKDVEIIPTVMWSDGTTIHTILSNPFLRQRHVDNIVKMVEDGKYDGVDIDYEGKKAETITYFSQFLKELKAGLGKKLLVCTIEARTPPDSLYTNVPAVINYANDYTEINKHCDRVQLMAYDQQRADIKLNAERVGEPYMPVSDPDWVEKVIKLALQSFSPDKLVLGIPTYGHHYTVTVSPNWYRDYMRIGALNLPDMLDVAKEYRVKPARNKAGEMSFSYIPKSSDLKFPRNLTIPKDTPDGHKVAAQALAYANQTGETVQFRIGWYSDAEAIKDKIDLAKKYNLFGISLFKIDGEEDQKLWRYLR